MVLLGDLESLEVLLPPSGLSGVSLQDREEDDVEGGVGGVQHFPPHVAVQVVHLLQRDFYYRVLRPAITHLEDVFSLLLGELEAHVEQSLLQLLVEGDLLPLHGAGDEPHGQLGVVREVIVQKVKPVRDIEISIHLFLSIKCQD